jgi:hypothetical protein
MVRNDRAKGGLKEVPLYSKIKGISYFGVEDTYDIQCEEPYHNFSANDIIIHNSGKSVFSMQLGAYIASKTGTKFDISNVCNLPMEFKYKILHSVKGSVIIYDESHRGLASARSLSEINNILKDMMMEMRQLNLVVFVVLPSFFLLDKYVALFRSRGMFHIYERKNKRGFWVYFSEKRKQTLYLKGKVNLNYNCMRWPGFRGRFYNQYTLNEKLYREKKKTSLKKEIRIEPREQRAICILVDLIEFLHTKQEMSYKDIINMIKNEFRIPFTDNLLLLWKKEAKMYKETNPKLTYSPKGYG